MGISTRTESSSAAGGHVSAGSARRKERDALIEARRHLNDVEKWFVKRGLPHFIENYKATDNVFSRTLPLILLLIVFQMGLELSSTNVTWKDRLIGGAERLAIMAALGMRLQAEAGDDLVGRLGHRDQPGGGTVALIDGVLAAVANHLASLGCLARQSKVEKRKSR